VRTALKFTGELLAQMYMGNISNWNDQRIAKLNPGVRLPNLPIMLLQRPDGTGSRYIFTEFLAKTCPEFRIWMRSSRPHRPSEVMEELSQKVADTVISTPGTIGYVTWSIAVRYGLPHGQVQNAAGTLVKVSPASVSAAAVAMQEAVFKNSEIPLLDPPGQNSYPLTSFVWAYLPVTSAVPERAANVYDFLDWCLDEGQSLIEGQGYNRLPKTITDRAQVNLRMIAK
jgi:phosphate transport system substrate-binding protein